MRLSASKKTTHDFFFTVEYIIIETPKALKSVWDVLPFDVLK